MNNQKLLGKLNESFLLETALLNAYQSIIELTKNSDLKDLFLKNSDISKEVLAGVNNLIEKLNGELIDDLSDIAFTINDSAEALANCGSMTPNQDLLFLDEVLILENLSKSNISVLVEAAEKTNDDKTSELKDIKIKIKERRKSIKSLANQIAINELMED
jgi:hypothetical protein